MEEDGTEKTNKRQRAGGEAGASGSAGKEDETIEQLQKVVQQLSTVATSMATAAQAITVAQASTSSSNKAGAGKGRGRGQGNQQPKKKGGGAEVIQVDEAGEASAAAPMDKKYKDLVVAVAKLGLAEARNVRSMRAVVLEVALIERKAPVVDRIKEATKMLAERMKALTDKEQRKRCDHPHCYVWRELVMYATKKAKEQDGQAMKDAAEELTRYGATTLAIDVMKEDEVIIPEESLKRMLTQIRFARVGRTYKAEQAKIEVGVAAMPKETTRAWTLIKQVLEEVHKDIEWRYGVPPRGPHERKIGELMSSMGLTSELEDW